MPENIPAPEAVAISLREHLEGRLSAMASHMNDSIRSVEERSLERMQGMRREIDLTQKAAQEAIEKAERAQQLRNEAMNEVREQIREERALLATQEALEAQGKRLAMLEKFMYLLMGAFVLLQLVQPYIPKLQPGDVP